MEQNQSMKKWYQIVPNPQNDNDEQQAFRITEGKFQDVIYKYNKFGVNDKPNDDGTLTYKFEYDILEIPEEIVNKQYADEEGREFETLIGDILIEVLQENIEVNESEDGKTRRYDFKEPLIQ